MQRLLHEPTIRLKGLSEHGGSGHGRLQIVRELFGLERRPAAEAAGELHEIAERRGRSAGSGA